MITKTPMTLLKVLGERIANEILMHFRSQKKSSQDVSLSDYIETGADGAPLALEDLPPLQHAVSRNLR